MCYCTGTSTWLNPFFAWCRLAEWVAFLHAVVIATVAMCRVRNPACTARERIRVWRYVNGRTIKKCLHISFGNTRNSKDRRNTNPSSTTWLEYIRTPAMYLCGTYSKLTSNNKVFFFANLSTAESPKSTKAPQNDSALWLCATWYGAIKLNFKIRRYIILTSTSDQQRAKALKWYRN